MALSTNSVSLLLVATFCCFIVNAAEESALLPSVGHRQSKQMFVMSPPLFNYYNPYGSQIMVPTGQGQIYPELFPGDFESALVEKFIPNQTQKLTITPTTGACTIAALATTGFSPCMKTSTANTGSFEITFNQAQIASVSIAPRQLRFSSVKVTCTDLTNVNVVMKSTTLKENGVKEAIEDKPMQLVAVVATGKNNGKVKCSWTSS